MNYIEINGFIKSLQKYQSMLSKQQLKTLRGQALSGNLTGAQKGLDRLLKKAVQHGFTKNINR
jgi:hypothetical protein